MNIQEPVTLPPGQRGEATPAVYINACAVSWNNDGEALVRIMFAEGMPGTPPVPRVAVMMSRANARALAVLISSADEAAEDKKVKP